LFQENKRSLPRETYLFFLFNWGVFNWGAMSYYFLLTIDVEDWFQVENFKRYIPFTSWPSHELRVEKNTHRLLDLLDSVKLNNSTNLQPVTGSYQVSTENVPKTKETSLRRRRIVLDHFHPESDPDKKNPKNPVNPV